MNNNLEYHYFYKITNNLNGHFYYGVHNTNNLDDGYMGSGKRLHYAYKKYGIENFSKEILKYFNSKEEAFAYELEIVNETLLKNTDCYNIVTGGKGSFPKQCNDPNNIRVKDLNGNCFVTAKNDPRWINGELVGITKGKFVFKNKLTNETKCLEINNVDLNIWEHISCNKVNVKDKYGNYLQVNIDDPRYVSGELTAIWKDRKHKEKTKQKMSLTHKKNNHQQGEKNSQFGTCWIHNNKENKKIKKEELEKYINIGWIKGRKMKFEI